MIMGRVLPDRPGSLWLRLMSSGFIVKPMSAASSRTKDVGVFSCRLVDATYPDGLTAAVLINTVKLKCSPAFSGQL